MDEPIENRLRKSGLQPAPLGRRSVAFAIDDMLISIIFIILLWQPISMAQGPQEVAAVINSVWLLIATAHIIYHTWFVWQYGATLGKIAMKMVVVETGTMQRPRFSVAFNRAIFRVISGMVFYLGFAWAFFDPLRQTWHDKVASTLVVDA
ncbi:RDD family protein [Hydrogenimonas urashimensis]|uniref:RDD family protein n=1 Tax=Hydrogenimonas urashimensis TaxID=2740515 RepID=UPI001916C697|nr:RDD family protein [Hydrogenimonas urashimensis]